MLQVGATGIDEWVDRRMDRWMDLMEIGWEIVDSIH
jgi:hypothetical protein